MQGKLKRHFSAIHLFGIALGMVISGQYFGWNYGFAVGGLYGLVIAAVIVTIFYLCFMFSYAELATAIPDAGGPSAYVRAAFGPFMGYMAGIVCLVEFVFAPPAIAVSIGSYLHFLLPVIDPQLGAMAAFILCIIINLSGTKYVGKIEVFITVLALLGLILFYCVGLPKIQLRHLWITNQSLPHGIKGIFAAIPFAIWLYLCIEGAAMAAEEVKNPQKDIPRGFLSAIFVLATCSILTLLVTVGLGVNINTPTDYPLPHALSLAYSHRPWLAKLVDFFGLLGLFASLNGIIIGYSRQIYALSREGYLPRCFSRLSSTHVPHFALIVPGIFGIICAGSAKVSNSLIILAVFGALLGYLLSLSAFFKLRYTKPSLHRPFKIKYQSVPLIALVLGVICLLSVSVFAIWPGFLQLFNEKISLSVVVMVIGFLSICGYLYALTTK